MKEIEEVLVETEELNDEMISELTNGKGDDEDE